MFLLYILVTGVAAGYCLLGIWAAVGRGHWFARACVLLIALALLLPVRAYEPLILFGLTAGMLACGWNIAPGLLAVIAERDKSQTIATSDLRFRLVDLFLGLIVAAVASSMASILVHNDVNVTWWRAAGAAGLLAIVASLVVLTVFATNSRQRWLRLGMLVLAVILVSGADAMVLGNWILTNEVLAVLSIPPVATCRLLAANAALYGAFALWMLVLTAGVASWRQTNGWAAFQKATRVAVMLAVVPLALFAAWVYWRMLDGPSIPIHATAEENVLPRILELAKASPRPGPTANDAICEELLPLLDRPSFVVWPPVRPDSEKSEGADLVLPRYLARGLAARADAMQALGKYDDAANEALAILRLAPMVDREGSAAHRIRAEGLIHSGHASLAKGRRHISAQEAAKAAHLIMSIAYHREPIWVTAERDGLWNNRPTPWHQVLRRAVLIELQGMEVYYGPLTNILWDQVPRNQCFARLLALDLLIRAHRAEHGKWPATLEEIAIEGQEELTVDPFSGRPFVYRPGTSDFVLYSVGEDETDDGGKFVNIRVASSLKPGFDFDVGTMVRP